MNLFVRSQMDQRIAYRSFVLAGGLAFLFLVVACVPLLFFVDTVVAAPTAAAKVLASLWFAFWFPIHIIPKFGFFLERTLLLSSATLALKVAPLLAVGWLTWALLFFMLLAFLGRVRRAS